MDYEKSPMGTKINADAALKVLDGNKLFVGSLCGWCATKQGGNFWSNISSHGVTEEAKELIRAQLIFQGDLKRKLSELLGELQ